MNLSQLRIPYETSTCHIENIYFDSQQAPDVYPIKNIYKTYEEFQVLNVCSHLEVKVIIE